MKNLLARALTLLGLLLAFVAPALHAGTFSTTAWTGDASTSIASGPTTWAYHFGATTNPTVNGVTVTGIATAPASNTNFDLVAPTPAVLHNDTNALTALTGTGSAVMAHDFVYSNASGGVESVTVKGLTPGVTYTVSFFSVGFEALLNTRLLTFASPNGIGTDSLSVDQDLYGIDKGIRVDYTFTAAAGTQLITITPQNPSYRFHLYGLALRAFVVSTNADSGAGSLRQALADAAAAPGANTVTFAPALSG